MVRFEEVKDVTTEEYFKHNSFAVDMFKAKYAHTKEDGSKENPAEVFYRIAKELSKFEEKSIVEETRDKWFTLMYEGWFRPGGSVISGVGSNKKCSLANCSTIPVEGDTLEDIAKAEYVLMKCAAYRQGVGIDLSNLRPRGAKLGNAAEKSTGTIPWGMKFNSVGEYVGQEGREPAILLSLKDNHPDLEEFITSKVEKGKIEKSNISVQVSDSFMDSLFKDKIWTQFFKTERELIQKTADPNHIFDLIAETAAQSAEPGVQFIDLMKKGTLAEAVYKSTGNPIYEVISTNACSEKPLPAYSVCNLLSLNLEAFSTIKEEYKKQLENIVPHLVRMADNVVQYELDNNLSPVEEQKKILERLREIGMGVTNVHGWLLKKNVQYDSDEGIEMFEEFMKYYSYNVFKASMELGKEKGNAPAFEEIENVEDLMYSTYFKNIVNEFFDSDPSKITNMRNMAQMSVAPTGSLSMSFPVPCISSGIEPIIAPFYWRKTRAVKKGEYSYYFVIPQRVKEYILSQIPPEKSEDYQKLDEFPGSVLDEEGKIGIELSEIIRKYISHDFFKPAHEIDYHKKIEMMGKVYKWVDAAISCTFNLPVSATKEDVKTIYKEAYENGVRAVSVYREGSREGILIFEDPQTHKQRYEREKGAVCLERPETIQFVCAPKRPEILSCNIHHCSVKGEKWLVLVGMLDDEPYEVFAGEQEDLYLPKSVREGEIIKKGNGQYSLRVKIRKTNVEIDDVAHELMNAEQRSLTRLLSLCLRHGVPHEFIVDQLKKANGDITDFSNVVSRILSRYIKEVRFSKGMECPNCGETMVLQEGCIKCLVCYYSRCA